MQLTLTQWLQLGMFSTSGPRPPSSTQGSSHCSEGSLGWEQWEQRWRRENVCICSAAITKKIKIIHNIPIKELCSLVGMCIRPSGPSSGGHTWDRAWERTQDEEITLRWFFTCQTNVYWPVSSRALHNKTWVREGREQDTETRRTEDGDVDPTGTERETSRAKRFSAEAVALSLIVLHRDRKWCRYTGNEPMAEIGRENDSGNQNKSTGRTAETN